MAFRLIIVYFFSLNIFFADCSLSLYRLWIHFCVSMNFFRQKGNEVWDNGSNWQIYKDQINFESWTFFNTVSLENKHDFFARTTVQYATEKYWNGKRTIFVTTSLYSQSSSDIVGVLDTMMVDLIILSQGFHCRQYQITGISINCEDQSVPRIVKGLFTKSTTIFGAKNLDIGLIRLTILTFKIFPAAQKCASSGIWSTNLCAVSKISATQPFRYF